MAFVKFRFSCKGRGATAALVIPATKFHSQTLESLSRFFPYSEAPKMARLEWQSFPTESEAHEYTFPEVAS